MRTLTWAQVSARRLSRSFLAAPRSDGDLARVAAAMVGAHAQVMSAAELSLCLRTQDQTRVGVRDALWNARTLVKTRGPRGTVHLLRADDQPTWTAALSAIPSAPGPWPEGVRFTAAETEAVLAAIADAAAAAPAGLTVDELTDAIVERVGAWAGERTMDAFQDRWPRWRQVEALAMRRGVLCFGPDRGRRATYATPPPSTAVDSATGLAWLVHGYLHAYGPATPAQFARWLGSPPDWTARLLARLPQLETVGFDGQEALVNAGDVGDDTFDGRGLWLLPYFDAYPIACHPRTTLFPGRAAERALNRGQAGNFPVVLIDGQVAGVWHQKRSGRRVTVTVETLRRPTKAQVSAIEGQAARIGAILEGTGSATLGEVTVSAHA
ncbi:winged helix DNA-binding domain-containing protein [Actinoplanes sp. NPDC051633]|uniref:winged helix DNA-binding domain-containing protein n=1 Tax=Actinoplanes sp. NPDC051633 TaxID=3155670 RepID=UPI003448D44C